MAPLISRIDAARYVIAVLAGNFPKSGRGAAQAGRTAEAPGRMEPGLPMELCAAGRSGRGRTPVGERHRADRRRHRWPVSPVVVARGWEPGRGGRDAGGHQSDLVGRSGRRRPLLDFDRLMRRSRRQFFAAANSCSTLSRQCSMRCANRCRGSACAAQQERLHYLNDALAAARRAVTFAQERFDTG